MRAVRRPGQGVDGGVVGGMSGVEVEVAAILVEMLAGEGVPDADHAVAAAGGDALPIGRPRRGEGAFAVSPERVDVLLARDIPDLHCAVAGDSEVLPAWGPCHVMYCALSAVNGDVFAGERVKCQRAADTSDGDARAVRRPRDRVPGRR